MAIKNIRNLAIIAHVDHGKTTLVDSLIKEGLSSQKNQKLGDLIMDSNPLERERGITILAKNTAVFYKGTKINIIDTPGHADFSGEVERIMNMADGCLLVVDAVDGPMPQTYYVLKQALEQNVKPIVVINKIDRKESRVDEVIEMVQDLFLELVTKSEDLDFPILFASAKENYSIDSIDSPKKNMEPLLDSIIENIPAPNVEDHKPFQMLVAALDFDNYLGQIAIGRIFSGKVTEKQQVSLLRTNGENQNYTIEKLFVFQELSKKEVSEVESGEIVAITGIENVSIGDTISSPDFPQALPRINIEEPTVKMTFGVNTSPFMGMEGKQCTSRMLHDRLMKELRTNISLKVEKTNSPDSFLVSGRGELQLAILVESLRREEFEFQVSRPEPVLKEIDGILCEPYEKLIINTSENFIGILNENLASRLAELTNMTHNGSGNVKLEYDIPTRGLIGFGSFFSRATRGNGTKDSLFDKFQPLKGEVNEASKGVLVASEKGTSVMYGLINAQGRGDTFIEPGTEVYEGMVIGMHNRDEDIPINVCKEKKLTNMRSSTADIAQRLSPPVKMSLEEALDFLSSDELLEATPKNFRLRKKELSATMRQRKKNRTTK